MLRKILQSQQYLHLVPTDKRKSLSKNMREFTWLLNVYLYSGIIIRHLRVTVAD